MLAADLVPLTYFAALVVLAQINDRKKKTGGKCRKPKNLEEAREIMGMPWATRKEIAQAIPPAYAEYLALQIMRELKAANSK
ncbi:MAG: hypothetical protein EBS05_24980 [Proteobacteria bacterium]|nr:hypothetical protein [Pseudomonadota bacterium]